MQAIAKAAMAWAVVAAAACAADAHEDLQKEASKLPPQDTLAGTYAPASYNASGGSTATPAPTGAQPVTGGSVEATTSGAGAGATNGAASSPASTGAGAGGTSQPAAGAHVPAGMGPGVKK